MTIELVIAILPQKDHSFPGEFPMTSSTKVTCYFRQTQYEEWMVWLYWRLVFGRYAMNCSGVSEVCDSGWSLFLSESEMVRWRKECLGRSLFKAALNEVKKIKGCSPSTPKNVALLYVDEKIILIMFRSVWSILHLYHLYQRRMRKQLSLFTYLSMTRLYSKTCLNRTCLNGLSFISDGF